MDEEFGRETRSNGGASFESRRLAGKRRRLRIENGRKGAENAAGTGGNIRHSPRSRSYSRRDAYPKEHHSVPGPGASCTHPRISVP